MSLLPSSNELKPEWRRKDLTFFTVATNVYLEFWTEMVRSFLASDAQEEWRARFVICTDRDEEAKKFVEEFSKFSNVAFEILKVENFRWPQATLQRFRLLRDFMAARSDIGDLFWMDADMTFEPNVSEALKTLVSCSKLKVVKHPGFFRGDHARDVFRTYSKFPLLLIPDTKSWLRHGSLGTWEFRRESTAFTERSRRRVYVAGGFWGGPRHAVEELTAEILRLMDIDQNQNVVPVWHDESYLNSWVAKNPEKFRTLPPSFCWTDTAGYLNMYQRVIVAVTKKGHVRALD